MCDQKKKFNMDCKYVLTEILSLKVGFFGGGGVIIFTPNNLEWFDT